MIRVAFGNVNFDSCSGPNSFGRRLAEEFRRLPSEIKMVSVDEAYDILLAFIEWPYYVQPRAKLIQRLDGIWFNTRSNWQQQNMAIALTYNKANGVIFQSEFDKELVFRFWGEKRGFSIIGNGTNVSERVVKRSVANEPRQFICASNWRPHKRLPDIIQLFDAMSQKNDSLIVAGRPCEGNRICCYDRVSFVGDISQETLRALFMESDCMFHLAWLDHCPNVVVEALAAGCLVICTDSGGTKELVGKCGIVLPDADWDYKPHDMYDPPKLNIENCANIIREKIGDNFAQYYPRYDLSIDIAARKYLEYFKSVLA